MKATSRIFILLSFFLMCMAAKPIKRKQYKAFDVLPNGLVKPPNGIEIERGIFLEETELMNAHYLEYLQFLAQDSSLQTIQKAYPDTSIFGSAHYQRFLKSEKKFYTFHNKRISFHKKLEHDTILQTSSSLSNWFQYFSLEENKNHPLVGITYEQALEYCAWRSAHTNFYFAQMLANNKRYQSFKHKKVTFTYRLPTAEEWEKAAAAGLNPEIYPYGLKDIYVEPHIQYNVREIYLRLNKSKSKKEIKQAIKIHEKKDSVLRIVCADKISPFFDFKKEGPDFIYQAIPNKLGFYHMSGNVAEMTSTKGIAKGGSFQHPLQECTISKNNPYSNASTWLGIRLICVVTITEP
jgi:formylglycine-generating enzyme required for sulfatase activity